MKLSITHIKAQNFRCFENLEQDLFQNTIVESDNEGGKSTLASAILWCLTGKDIEGNTTFEIVPQGKYGVVSPLVELECLIDNDTPITFTREYKASYARDKSFKDYATKCYINGVEKTIKKFQEQIADEICDENVFKILSNPYTFVENCPKEQKETMWQGQRRLLMQLVDDKADSEIAETQKRFKPLVEPLKRYKTAGEYLKFVKQQTSQVQKEIDGFDSKLEQQGLNIEKVELSEEKVKSEYANCQEQLKELENEAKQRQQEQSKSQANDLKEQMNSLNSEKETLIANYQNKLADVNAKKKDLENKITDLRNKQSEHLTNQGKYADVVKQLKATKITTVCPTCKRPISEQMKQAQEKHIAERIDNGEKWVEKERAEAEKYLTKINSLTEQINTMKEPVYPARVKVIEEELNVLISNLSVAGGEIDLSDIEEKKQELYDKMEKLRDIANVILNNQKSEQLIAEIEKENKEKNILLNKLQKASDITKEFISFKCENAEKEINKLFKTVKFQLFEKNKSNDDIKEVCNMTFNGHKYEDLSASTKLVANLELLSIFQKHYNVYIPVVMDNMESVTADIVSETQTILLYVKEELCPECKGKSGRRKPNGLWECENCHKEWEKKLEIKEK